MRYIGSILAILIFFTGEILSQRHAQEYLFGKNTKFKDYDEDEEVDMVFYFYPMSSNILDLRHFKEVNPGLETVLADKVLVIAPELENAVDTVYAVGYLYDPNYPDYNRLIIIIVSNYSTYRPSYYVDYNLDGDYTNDGNPLKMISEEQVKIKLYDEKIDRNYHFWLINPYHQKQIDTYEKYAISQRLAPDLDENGISDGASFYTYYSRNRIILSGSILGAFGVIKYTYTNLSSGLPTYYDVNYSSKGLSIGGSYSVKRFQFELNGSYENIYYWASEKETVRDPIEICFSTIHGIRCTLAQINEIKTNIDILPVNRFSVGFRVEYNLPLVKSFALSPHFSLSAFIYDDNFYVPNRADSEDIYEFENQFTYSFGLTGKVLLPKRSLMFLRASYMNVGFNPSNYFEQLEISNLTKSNRQGIVEIGFHTYVSK